MNYLPLIYILLPILCSILIYIFHCKLSNLLYFFCQGILIISYIVYFSIVTPNFTSYITIGGWPSSVGITFLNNGITLMFIAAGLFIWLILGIYSWGYFKKDYKFYFFLLFAEGAYMGIIQSNDLFNLFVFFELLTIIATFLILYKKDIFALKAGLNYLLVNSFAIVFYLIGVMLVYALHGTVTIRDLQNVYRETSLTRLDYFAYVMMISGLCIKCGFFPLFNWLPKAHSASPAVVSALLSGVIVKTAILVFVTINQLFNIMHLDGFFLTLGFITAYAGGVMALCQKDIKRLLAFSTVSQIGIMLIGFSQHNYVGGYFHLFTHMIAKSLLFLCVGIIINHYENREMPSIRGVFTELPVVTVLMGVGILTLIGFPGTNGYVSKGLIEYGLNKSTFLTYNFELISFITILYFVRLAQIFRGEPISKIKRKEGHKKVYGTLLILGITCLTLYLGVEAIGSYFYPAIKVGIHIKPMKILMYVVKVALGIGIHRVFIINTESFGRRVRHIYVSYPLFHTVFIVFMLVLLFYSTVIL